MDEYKFVSPSQTFTLPPLHFENQPLNFQLPTLPLDLGESKEAPSKQKVVAQFTV